MSRAETVQLVDEFQKFFRRYYDNRDEDDGDSQLSELLLGYPNDKKSLYVNYNDLYTYDEELATDLVERPDEVLEHAEEALAQYDNPANTTLEDAHVRVYNIGKPYSTYPDHYDPADVENKLRAIEGQVTKVSEKRAEDEEVTFECQRCGSLTHIPQSGEKLQEPHECQGCERQGPFHELDANHNESRTKSVNHRLIRIQTPPEIANGQGGGTLDINLRDDIVDDVEVGDRATVNTIIRTRREGSAQEKTTRKENYGDAVSIEIEDTDFEDIEITDEDEQEIRSIAAGTPFEDIYRSIKPSHKGDEDVKKAMALQLVSGVEKPLPDGATMRGDIHILEIGDPGTGKSRLLSYHAEIAPRSVYTSGKQSSNAGLTCAAVKDDFGNGGWTIEGGAVVEANKGLLCVDEFDKTGEEDREGLMEALSKQTVSPAKAGISGIELPAKTSMLGAANPKHGRFDPYQPFGEQLDLPVELLSRFDLIFTLTDQPDEEKDIEKAEHVLNVSQAGQRRARSDIENDEVEPSAEFVPEVGPELLRKYIAYAKRNYKPVMSDEAKQALKEFYVNIRQANDDDGPVPTTLRKLEALIRLSEASARIRLSDEIEVVDAERVIQIVRSCMEDVGIDPESGQYDVDVVETGASQTQKQRYQRVYELIEDLAESSGKSKGAAIEDVMAEARQEGMTEEQVEHAVDHWKQMGEVYEPGGDHWQTT